MYLQVHSRSLQRAVETCDRISVDGAQCAMRMHHKLSTLTKWSDVIIAVLKDVTAARQTMLNGSDGLVKNLKPGQIIIDHTTTDVETARECHEIAQSRGGWYVDAPLSGSPESAFHGKLTIMAGSSSYQNISSSGASNAVDPLQRVMPILRMYAENVVRVGGPGAGAAAKGILSILEAAHSVVAAEAMAMAHSSTVIDDPAALIQVLDSTWGSSVMLRRNAQPMHALLVDPTNAVAAGREEQNNNNLMINNNHHTVDQMLDNLRIGMASLTPDDEAQQLRTDRNNSSKHRDAYPLTDGTHRLLTACSKVAGIGNQDIATIVNYLSLGRQTSSHQQSTKQRDALEQQRYQQQQPDRIREDVALDILHGVSSSGAGFSDALLFPDAEEEGEKTSSMKSAPDVASLRVSPLKPQHDEANGTNSSPPSSPSMTDRVVDAEADESDELDEFY